MNQRHPVAAIRSSMAQRLREAARVLLDEEPDQHPDAATDAAVVLDYLVRHVQASGAPRDEVWLLLVATSGCFPTEDEVLATRRVLRLLPVTDATLWLLDESQQSASATGLADAEMDIVVGGVVADVDFTARHELHTGIQRVVRETAPRWTNRADLTLTAWTERFGALRRLNMTEEARVLRWPHSRTMTPDTATAPHRLVVPWRSILLLMEVPIRPQSARLAAVAAHSGNRLVALGYDCIPVVSADAVPPTESDRFARYLAVIKYADLVIGISETASQEFGGFAAMLASSGLSGPRVTTCVLADTGPGVDGGHTTEDRSCPSVVVVGSHEPRKNHLAVLDAAERIWRDGHRFSLRFLGGSRWDAADFEAEVARLRAAGRMVVAEHAVDDETLWRAYREARFSVFPSLHEGYGLPVVESLACGTPVLTSAHGSMREIAHGGGVLTVDPRDDEALYQGMTRMILDDDFVEGLRAEALSRPRRSWDDYADDLWSIVTDEGVPR